LAIAVLALAVFGPAPTRAGDTERPVRVYLFAGQSNMVGASAITAELDSVAPALLEPPDDVLFFGPDDTRATHWGWLPSATESTESFYGPGFGPELTAARRLARLHPRSATAIVKFARNGTSLHTDWNPDRRGGLYDAMLTRTRAALEALRPIASDVRIAGVFWMQGEWDADTLANADAYGVRLQRLIARLRADLRAPRVPVVIGRIRDVRRVSLWRPYSHIVRREQAEVAVADPLTHLVSTDGLSIDPRSPVHFDTRGTVRLGELFVQRRFGL
jgi:hypothetical protein